MADIIELIEAITLEKEGCSPIHFTQGTVFKVEQDFPNCYLVRTDDGFTFTLEKQQEHKTWVKL
ncbi:hypothetical protein [Acinetobacter sp. MD2(2019)]|uniref:hypothetical protein n=1 Tax=Acinetobacter sp. MD2(2019) TaxID=2605273 RepID=UPI002D1F38BE|nr:hypothetical protein [Acinetobacter sp. MD2(2019)]MEB3753883.1 hypothetical protein [Acinetobacter sp. MD2(2019)]